MSQPEIQHEKLREMLTKEIKEWKTFAANQIKEKRKQFLEMEPFVIKMDGTGFDYFIGSKMIYVSVDGESKAEFSATVRRLALLLGEPPDISVNPDEYVAQFKQSRVHAYMRGATDCKLIDVVETVTVTRKKPHPECLAALSELENIA
jgi:hypothetical protein